jgi:hypothetical protein
MKIVEYIVWIIITFGVLLGLAFGASIIGAWITGLL